MKTIKQFFKITVAMLTIILMSVLSTGCKKTFDQPDKLGFEGVKFAINAISVDKSEKQSVNTKSTMSMAQFMEFVSVKPDDVTNVRIGIDGTVGNPIISQVLSFSLNGGFGETGIITLNPGNHNLTNMELLKEITPDNYEVLYSAVVEGAFLASFVNSTIPLSFEVLSGMPPNTINIDVVSVDEWAPADFGFSKFSIGMITATPLYFYGADVNNNPSVMSMDVLRGTEVIYQSDSENGMLKVYYPDVYNENDATEVYTFNLNKDGVEYNQTLSVATLKTYPREIIMLNVSGSGMAGFAEIPVSENIVFSTTVNSENYGMWSGFTVTQNGVQTFTSPVTQSLSKTISYLNTSENDETEMITIVMSYKKRNSQYSNTWFPEIYTKTAVVSVAEIKASGSPINLVWAISDFNNDVGSWFFL